LAVVNPALWSLCIVVAVPLGNRPMITASTNSQKYMMAQSARQDRMRDRTFTELRSKARPIVLDFSGEEMAIGC
jgi:hypothetical protein